MKYYIYILMIFSFGYVQSQTIKGKIQDTFTNPLDGAYVLNTTSENHTHTLENGRFVLDNVSVGDTLTIRLLGFETQQLVVRAEDFAKEQTITLQDKIFQLDELIVKQEVNPLQLITKLDMKTSPVNSSQEVLRRVPGLFIGQHAGGGKAEQIFLRGFDVDHGTDVAISVDGMPVNMVSHAHGQGYADLHFVIPETIGKVDFGKGSYYADQGNFNTAGYVSFYTKERFKNNQIKIEAGDFNTFRTVGLFNLFEASVKENMILALEYLESDGPFESEQNFNRINLATKYTTQLSDTNKLSVLGSHFTSRWDASGQIPVRAVEQGLISRFGAIDDTEGGTTSRTNFKVNYDKFISDNTTLQTNAYYTHYDFELYSNFTFFLNDPINGDQIRQREDRDIFGFNSRLKSFFSWNDINININAGIGVRNDAISNNELSRTRNRTETVQNVSLGNVNETNSYSFLETVFDFGTLKITPALRWDYFKYIYEDALLLDYRTQSNTKSILTPKLQFSYDPTDNLNVFLKSGIGFHGNDTRVVVAQQGEKILPKAYSMDIGLNWKPFSKLFLNTTFWYLKLDQEFVYVGDEGVVEPSGKTRRLGLDLSARYQIKDWLYFDTDFTYTKSRSLDAPEAEHYIPLAPKYTATGGISFDKIHNFSGGVRYRYLGDRAANEDNSIVAEGYTIVDANVNYTWNSFNIGITIENLFDREWNETQFATQSRLFNESEPVEEIHFTPGTPFFAKLGITYSF
ncbi:outer membrane receptor for Fe3+-dicitrate [Aquimarina sp. EL_43]|uniref:TonB-dependent receptor n=1 Tax=unclassified Aquimarina TaxID=2627091 RepID=UPI0018CB1FA2|nr:MULTISPECIES: TonB-dependent receptor [unclassified Aquimarina]MBG6130671.1 outer membrane receptor for Fe3+-dicitrate [Aquimarina sp. EL_35]MBG6151183.1 outer membrane receptor for Fe3+-dicitrate [Aquimarina sp. EL_32]MBG6169073.1 outer membrane receptor for Fe3+-dicitrate [Aquimarina sp. EL_43]